MILYDTVNQFINSLEHWEDFSKTMSIDLYIKEFRTIELNLPRRSGKTYSITRLASENSALLLTKYPKLYSGIRVFNDEYAIEAFIRGRNFYGLRYSCILIDEGTSINIEKLVVLLASRDLLAKDFFILKLGTR